MTQPDFSRLEHRIAGILRIGIAASAICFVVGLVLWTTGRGPAVRVLDAGLVALMCVPISRIGASFVDAVRRRDRLLAWSTALVLVMLALTTVYSMTTQP